MRSKPRSYAVPGLRRRERARSRRDDIGIERAARVTATRDIVRADLARRAAKRASGTARLCRAASSGRPGAGTVGACRSRTGTAQRRIDDADHAVPTQDARRRRMDRGIPGGARRAGGPYRHGRLREWGGTLQGGGRRALQDLRADARARPLRRVERLHQARRDRAHGLFAGRPGRLRLRRPRVRRTRRRIWICRRRRSPRRIGGPWFHRGSDAAGGYSVGGDGSGCIYTPNWSNC